MDPIQILDINNKPITVLTEETYLNAYLEQGCKTTTNIYNGNFILPMLVDEQYIESATADEIAQNSTQKNEEFLTNFLIQKRKDGEKYFEDKNLEITKKLIGKSQTELFPILAEIDEKIYKILNLIKTGDFASAVLKLQNTQAPSNVIVLELYNSVQSYTLEYYQNKYPKQ